MELYFPCHGVVNLFLSFDAELVYHWWLLAPLQFLSSGSYLHQISLLLRQITQLELLEAAGCLSSHSGWLSGLTLLAEWKGHGNLVKRFLLHLGCLTCGWLLEFLALIGGQFLGTDLFNFKYFKYLFINWLFSSHVRLPLLYGFLLASVEVWVKWIWWKWWSGPKLWVLNLGWPKIIVSRVRSKRIWNSYTYWIDTLQIGLL